MKKKKKYKGFSYRGIWVEVNGPYSFKENNVVIFTPDIERYSKGLSGVRSFIDKYLADPANQKHIRGDFPF